jgi:hypothetical protein
MPKVSEAIPEALQPRLDAAVTWFNSSDDAAEAEFKVTGILDADESLKGSDELQLVLCGGDRCEQRSFRVPGPRLSWLDEKLAQHAFVVLLFYRGFW